MSDELPRPGPSRPAVDADLMAAIKQANEIIGDQRREIERLRKCVIEIFNAIPGGSICDSQRLSDAVRAIAAAHGVEIPHF